MPGVVNAVLIRDAATSDIAMVRRLFEAYAASLDVDLCFQGFHQELASLPGKYDPILICPGQGCVALRPLSRDVAEAKRLYVRPSCRGTGLGRRLADAIVQAARTKGYRSVRLDSLPQMAAAIAMYRRMGFREIEPYYDNPVPGAVFLELAL